MRIYRMGAERGLAPQYQHSHTYAQHPRTGSPILHNTGSIFRIISHGKYSIERCGYDQGACHRLPGSDRANGTKQAQDRTQVLFLSQVWTHFTRRSEQSGDAARIDSPWRSDLIPSSEYGATRYGELLGVTVGMTPNPSIRESRQNSGCRDVSTALFEALEADCWSSHRCTPDTQTDARGYFSFSKQFGDLELLLAAEKGYARQPLG
jgi:hypothetical protein